MPLAARDTVSLKQVSLTTMLEEKKSVPRWNWEPNSIQAEHRGNDYSTSMVVQQGGTSPQMLRQSRSEYG